MPDNNTRPGETVALDVETSPWGPYAARSVSLEMDLSRIEARLAVQLDLEQRAPVAPGAEHPRPDPRRGALWYYGTDSSQTAGASGTTTGRNVPIQNIIRTAHERLAHRSFLVSPDNFGALTGLRADTVIVDDRSDRSDDLTDALSYGSGFDYAALAREVHDEVLPRVGRRLVPVGPLRHIHLERFDKRALADIQRPDDDSFLELREELRRKWHKRLYCNACRVVAGLEESFGVCYDVSVLAMSQEQTSLVKEIKRHMLMLVEDGVPRDDMLVFTDNPCLFSERRRDTTGFVLVAWGLCSDKVRVIDASRFKENQ
jgi:hypothetical protein